jgi:hypothetical protein
MRSTVTRKTINISRGKRIMTSNNISFALIQALALDGVTIDIRTLDGFVNATKMAQSAGKEWSNYYKSAAAQEFARELSRNPNYEIVESDERLSTGSEVNSIGRGPSPVVESTTVGPNTTWTAIVAPVATT